MQPKRLGKYLLLDRLAVGGMAEVFRGKLIGEQGFEKLVVIKQMLPQVAAQAEMVTAFIDEARLAALLQHENIIHVYDFGEMDGGYFIAMEYLFGKELRAALDKSLEAQRRIPLADCLYIAARICDGLHYAHELKDLHQRLLNIIHRDISPQNIFVTYDGKIKIIDFGIAKTSVQSVRTQTGLVKGKLAYMSPEQAKGSTLDRRSDIFSTGAVLYELITGCRMYQGTSTAEVLQKVIEADFPPLETIQPDIPAPVCEILNRSLAKEKSDRYENIGQMYADIEECMFASSLRGNAQTLSTEMKGLFERDYAAETADIQRVIAAGASSDAAITTAGGGVSPSGGSGAQTSAAHFDGEGTRTETVFSPSDQAPSAALPADRGAAASESPPGGRPNAAEKRIHADRRSNWRTTLINATVTVLVVAAMIWLLLSLKPKTAQPPVSETPPVRVADTREETRPVQPETHKVPPRTPAPAEVRQEPKASPPPIKHISSRSKQIASARSVSIKSLLANGEKNLKKYRLTTPEKDCAYFYFKEVLRLDPRNRAARNGIRRIGDAYGRLADGEIRRFEYEKAEVYVNKGLKVAPNNARLLALKEELARPRPLRFLDDVGNRVKNLFE